MLDKSPLPGPGRGPPSCNISSFSKSKGKPWQLGFCDSETQGWSGVCGGFCGSLLREVEGWYARCRFESVKTLKGARAGRSPIWVMWIQIWADLCGGIS